MAGREVLGSAVTRGDRVGSGVTSCAATGYLASHSGAAGRRAAGLNESVVR